jgi:hypothetical protein
MKQAVVLQKFGHVLGARILCRSSFETIAILIYLNDQTENLITKQPNTSYDDFSKKTAKLLLGTRNKSTNHEAINILTILKKCEKKYEGIEEIYGNLCESAHPNWGGMSLGYSTIDTENYVTLFHNQWSVKYAKVQILYMNSLLDIFENEYSNVWPEKFEKLEKFIVENEHEFAIGE